MQETSITNTGNDLLADIAINLERASVGKRFLNYIIDIVVFYVACFLAGAIVGLATGSPTVSQFELYFIALAVFFLLYFVEEAFMKGKTIGKLITGTRAVNEDGTPINAKTAAIRTVIRFVPFEPFSAFGYLPWHDSWSRTIVIDERRSTLPQ